VSDIVAGYLVYI